MLKTNVIHCGECAEMMRQHLPDNSIDLTVTSPPYDNLREYNGYTFDFEAIAQQLWRVTKPGGVVVWVVADATINGSETGTSFRQALRFMEIGFNLHDTMIYKTSKPPMNDRRYQSSFEYMFVLSKCKPTVFNPIYQSPAEETIKRRKHKLNKSFNRNKSGEWKPIKNWNQPIEKVISINVWEINSSFGSSDRSASLHPAIFPEALARDHIISWSNPGDIVLDPMCGSGTTLKMAVEQGRQYIGIDISPEYCELSAKRVAGARVPLPGLVAGKPNNQNQAELLQRGLWE